MPLSSHLRPLSYRLGEKYEEIVNQAIDYSLAMKGKPVPSIGDACDAIAYLATQLAVVEGELAEEKKQRHLDRDDCRRAVAALKLTVTELKDILKRFGYTVKEKDSGSKTN